MITLVSRGGSRLPTVALILGGAGLIPFLVGAASGLLAPGDLGGLPIGRIVIVYGALILSFLGGVIWGLGSAALAHDPLDLEIPRILPASVVPALIGWVSVFLSDALAPMVLAITFLAVLMIDRWAVRLGLTPPWWMRFRVRLTVVVVISLLLMGALAGDVTASSVPST